VQGEENVKITLMKVGALYCQPCIALEKRGTLQKFGEKHPEVKVEVHDDNEYGDSKAWARFADKWKVRSTPTLLWVAGGEELFRSTDVSARGIEEQYERALKKAGL
jgi:hypothetical protein